MAQYDEFVELAHQMANIARKVIRESYIATSGYRVKADGSPVTEVDLAVETALRDHLAKHAPNHGIMGEEFGTDGLDQEFVWVLDPIDGTRQFAAGLPVFGTLIALCHGGTPVIGVIEQPLLEQRCVGVQGRQTLVDGAEIHCLRRDSLDQCVLATAGPEFFARGTHVGAAALRDSTRWNIYDSGCLGYISLASGQIDICMDGTNLDPFDICALVPAIIGAGGCLTGWQGEALTIESCGPILASGSETIQHLALAKIQDAMADMG